MRIRLEPIDILDLSKGLNKSRTSPSLLDMNEMSESENMRHPGKGKMTRRDGMKIFASAGIEPVQADADERAGRFIFPYLRRITQTANKRTIIETVAAIKNYLYRCVDGSIPANIYLKDAATVRAFISWKPHNTEDSFRQHEDFPNCGAGFLDERIYLGTNHNYEDFEDSLREPIRDVNFPYSILVVVSLSSVFTSFGDKLTGQISGAGARLGYRNDDYKTLFLYNWNGIPFQAGEDIKDESSNSALVTRSVEYGLAGVILDHGTDPTSSFQARKWGIEKPFTQITGAAGTAGAIEAGAYNIKYTFIRYENASTLSGDNSKLSGGEFISESAPSPVKEIAIVADKKIQYTEWEASPDPQVTHIRIYRALPNTTVYRHVADALIGTGSGTINDNLDATFLNLEQVILDTDYYQVFGENGENSGDIIEIANRRVFVAGNKKYPYVIYMSRARVYHKDTEYFYSLLKISENPGQNITALKWWNNALWIFLERSIYKITDITVEIPDAEIVSKGIGCATRRGVLDMGDYLLIMSQKGLLRFNGSIFDKVSLTEGTHDIIGTDLLNAIITQDDNYIHIITETSRALGLIVTLKYSDGSYALGTDTFNSDIALPEQIAFIPPLKNFGNTVDDSDCILGLFQNPDDEGNVRYWIGKYNLTGENKDLLFSSGQSGHIEYPIIAKFSPRVFDFGSFVECTLEELIAYLLYCGKDTTTHKVPTGKWLIKIYLDPAEDGTAKRYEEVEFKPVIDRTKSLARTAGDPIQPKFTKPFSATYKHQIGGVYSDGSNPAALFADYQQILFKAGLSSTITGRMWKFLFEYKDEANFEFSNIGFKFIREEEDL